MPFFGEKDKFELIDDEDENDDKVSLFG